MDPVRNPFAPGAGQRPPELTGRDREPSAFKTVLERSACGGPERSSVLTGLHGALSFAGTRGPGTRPPP
jgi:hypothetical protein